MATEHDPSKFELLAAIKSAAGTSAKPTILCTASSDQIDLGMDRMQLSALNQMAADFPGMTIFLNHRHEVPTDVVGTVASARIVQREGRNDLDLSIAVDVNNPRALQTYEQVKSGVKLGVSIGVLVREANYTTEVVSGQKVKILNVTSVTTLEASIVGIPASRVSWVQGVLKAASYAARSQIALRDDDEIDGSELVAAKSVVRLLLAAISAKDAELTESRELVGELTKGLGWFLDMPQPRKTDPSVTASLNTLADKFPDLDERILASIARAQS